MGYVNECIDGRIREGEADRAPSSASVYMGYVNECIDGRRQGGLLFFRVGYINQSV